MQLNLLAKKEPCWSSIIYWQLETLKNWSRENHSMTSRKRPCRLFIHYRNFLNYVFLFPIDNLSAQVVKVDYILTFTGWWYIGCHIRISNEQNEIILSTQNIQKGLKGFLINIRMNMISESSLNVFQHAGAWIIWLLRVWSESKITRSRHPSFSTRSCWSWLFKYGVEVVFKTKRIQKEMEQTWLCLVWITIRGYTAVSWFRLKTTKQEQGRKTCFDLKSC